MRSKRMSSVSEQDHLNPRDPLYYAPRSLRERSASRGASSETTFSNVAQSIKNALSLSGEASQKPAINEFQSLLASTPPSAPPASEQDGQLLKQFMQWREKPDPATPQRANP